MTIQCRDPRPQADSCLWMTSLSLNEMASSRRPLQVSISSLDIPSLPILSFLLSHGPLALPTSSLAHNSHYHILAPCHPFTRLTNFFHLHRLHKLSLWLLPRDVVKSRDSAWTRRIIACMTFSVMCRKKNRILRGYGRMNDFQHNRVLIWRITSQTSTPWILQRKALVHDARSCFCVVT